MTGLPSAGKSTLAHLLEAALHAKGRHTYLLDGDNVRHGLSRDLGFSAADRDENIRRVAKVVRLLVDAGLVVIVAFISPYRREREFARSPFAQGDFVEIHVATPLEVCERREPKGMYAKAPRGELPAFTSVNDPFQPPLAPEIRVDAASANPEEMLAAVLHQLDGT